MADSVVHVEIEDVLASVRRLVAQELPIEVEPTEPTEVCFVLTPAHRIENQNTDLTEQDVDAGRGEKIAAQNQQPTELEQLLSDVSRQTENGTATDNTVDDDVPPETSSNAPVNYTASEYQSMAEAWKKELAAVGDMASATENHTATTPINATGSTLEDRIAELEVAVSQSREDWEPDGSEASKKPEVRQHIFEVVDNTTDTDAVDLDMAGVDTGAEDVSSDIQDNTIPKLPPLGAGRESASVLVLSREMSGSSHATPSDMAAKIDEEGSVLDESDMSNLVSTAEPEPQSPMFSHAKPGANAPLMLVRPVSSDDAPPPPTEPEAVISQADKSQIVPEDDVFLDVEALRNMIGELVREELRGKMGERITQNVRMMVRQEIDRALISRDRD